MLLYHPGNLEGEGEEGRDSRNLEGEGEEGRDSSSFSMGYQEEKLLNRKLNKGK